jgi:methylthioribose-1-phosphate isomerase
MSATPVRAARGSEPGRRRAPREVRPFEWLGDRLRLLDQTALPLEETYVEAREPGDVARAIRRLQVRGAPLLGVVAGYGVALAALGSAAGTPRGICREVRRAAKVLAASRPTAVNIAWAVERVSDSAEAAVGDGIDAVRRAALDEAHLIAAEDAAACRAIGELGAALVPWNANILTHCNTGALATGGIGTALGVVRVAHEAGKRLHVWVGETRPILQGARLTAWELKRLGIPMTLVADTAPGSLMARGAVDLVVVGADRIAANGDVANKVGTYQLAVLAAHHGIPLYVAAPISTVDLATRTGEQIVMEQRNPREVTEPFGVRIAPEGTWAVNPAFDVTPAGLVTAIVTDRGVVRPPFRSGLRRVLRPPAGSRGRS